MRTKICSQWMVFIIMTKTVDDTELRISPKQFDTKSWITPPLSEVSQAHYVNSVCEVVSVDKETLLTSTTGKSKLYEMPRV